MANEKIKIKIRALQVLSIGDGIILQVGEEAEIERTQASIDTALDQKLYERIDEGDGSAEQEVNPNG